MTSKEFILSEIDNLKSILAVAREDNLKTIIKESEEDIEQYNQVLKDLEVLEILKKRLNIKIPYGSVNVISANNDDDYLLFEVELKEHTKIEEWLDDRI